jgi:hypothetical protein
MYTNYRFGLIYIYNLLVINGFSELGSMSLELNYHKDVQALHRHVLFIFWLARRSPNHVVSTIRFFSVCLVSDLIGMGWTIHVFWMGWDHPSFCLVWGY